MKRNTSLSQRIAALLSFSCMVSVPMLVQAADTDRLDTFELEPIIVTATATPIKAQDVYASVAVIDREEIEQNHYRTLYEALQHIEGVHTVLYGDGVGFEISGESNPTLRGSMRVVVLVDGVSQNLGTAFRSGATTYNMDDVERIEVLRGSASTLYGANAVGGVINIITRKGVTGTQNRVAYTTGSYGLNKYHISSIGSEGKVFWAVSGDKTLSGDVKDGNGKERHSLLNASSGDIKLGYHVSDTVDVMFKYNRHFQHMEWVRPYANWDATGDGSLSTNRLTFTVDYNAKDGSEKNQFSIYRGIYHSKRFYYNTNGHGRNNREIGDDKFFTVVNRYYKQLDRHHRLAAGFAYQKTGTRAAHTFLSETSVYLQDEWNINDALKLTLGGRYVHPNSYKSNTLLSANLGYKVNDKVSVYIGSNAFYLTPTAANVFGNIHNGGGYWPNPNLKPTSGRTHEIGANIALDKKTFLEFNFYKRIQKDAIAAGFYNGQPAWINIPGKSAVRGAEIAFHKYFGKYFHGRLGYAHLGADSLSLIPRFPRDQMSLSLSYERGQYNINLEGIGRYDIVPTSPFLRNHAKYMPETTYWLWNLSANYKINKDFTVFARVNNIFDLYYMTATLWDSTTNGMAYITCPGRNFVIGADYRF